MNFAPNTNYIVNIQPLCSLFTVRDRRFACKLIYLRSAIIRAINLTIKQKLFMAPTEMRLLETIFGCKRDPRKCAAGNYAFCAPLINKHRRRPANNCGHQENNILNERLTKRLCRAMFMSSAFFSVCRRAGRDNLCVAKASRNKSHFWPRCFCIQRDLHSIQLCSSSVLSFWVMVCFGYQREAHSAR